MTARHAGPSPTIAPPAEGGPPRESGLSRALALNGKYRWVLGVVSALLIVGLAQVFVESQESAEAFTRVSYGSGSGARPEVGQPAPDFQGVDLSGNTVRLSDYKGRPVWINFWATWCPPCRAEMPEVSSAYEQAKGQGLVLLAVSVGESGETVAGYLSKTGYDIPAVLDESAVIATRYMVNGFPTHLFIDTDGVIRDIRVGGLNQQAIQQRLKVVMPPG